MMVNFFKLFCAFLSLFISNASIVRINFGANLDAQYAGNHISGIQISKIFWGSSPPDPPFMRGDIGGGFQQLLSPSNILSHMKVPFQPPPPRENP
jgi:hypothetical protein